MQKLAYLKPLFLFIILMISSTLSLATELDAKQQLQAKLALLVSYQANFSQTVVDIENSVLQQATGRIVMQQPNKLYWELFAPNESVLLADGQSIWSIDPFLEQVVAYKADTTLKNNPLILLTDPNSEKWDEFKVSHSKQQFFISAIAPNGGIESLRLTFKGDRLVELESQDGQQQKSLLTFSEIQQNNPIAAGTFVFEMPEGYELDDQR
ncbi:outer membrane lipoprotein chaperone LolA [uncultured Paraglaciecola sp.]|uniref:outer membrane lipoprotein chaperone LolA n=1 Tax=uncultured Paraglaciecola sp. TaxID=1765024 RepID=UPI00261EF368|nr:outer membrane lipoprotein chaperone LolA [uncultured Paraglaciecola sp.]